MSIRVTDPNQIDIQLTTTGGQTVPIQTVPVTVGAGVNLTQIPPSHQPPNFQTVTAVQGVQAIPVASAPPPPTIQVVAPTPSGVRLAAALAQQAGVRIAEVGGKDIPILYSTGHDIEIGVAWDFLPGAPVVDLDCSILCLNAGGAVLDAAYYNQKICCSGAIVHSGDNKTGQGEGFDESIKVDLDKVSDSVIEMLVFVVNAYQGGTLQDVQNASCTVLELAGAQQIPLATCPVSSSKRAFEGVIVGILYKDRRSAPTLQGRPQWLLRNVSRMIGGKNFQQSMPEIKQCLASAGLLDPAQVGLVMSFDKKFNMKKDQFIEIPAELFRDGSDLFVGLGWEANNPRGILDLDASIILVDEKGNKIDVVNFANRSFLQGVIKHHGDNQTGIGKGDDEKIDIDLDKLPRQVFSLFVIVNVYNSWGSFADVTDAYVRLVACKNNHEFCRYNLEGHLAGAPCLIFCKVFRSPIQGAWLMQTLGVGCQGRVATEQVCLQGCWAVDQGLHFGTQRFQHMATMQAAPVTLIQPTAPLIRVANPPPSMKATPQPKAKAKSMATGFISNATSSASRIIHSRKPDQDKCCCTIN